LVLLGAAHAADTNGFAVQFTSADGRISDRFVLPNVWLFVEEGKPATPFLPPGKFTGHLGRKHQRRSAHGLLFQSRRTQRFAQAGDQRQDRLETSTPGALSKAVQINKGANAVKATLTSPAKGDTFVRVGWTEKGTNVNPIPSTWISHATTPESEKATTLYLGRELFLEYRCAKCHTEKFSTAIPELNMDAPLLDGIGARRNHGWLAKWILDPKATRASVHMPKMLHGDKAQEDASAVAAYLATLKTEPVMPSGLPPVQLGYNAKAIAEITKRSGGNAGGGESNEPADKAEHKPIFERLHCFGCHNAPDKPENDPTKISLKHVAEKFTEGKLVEFLREPEKHFAWSSHAEFQARRC
jgi:cbb3-type cytochrome oxidase cytochrome c subunit